MAKKNGRPTDYNEEKALAICDKIINGMSVRKICAEEDMPSVKTLFRWLDAHEEFRQQYARARDIQGEMEFDEIIDIADLPIGADMATIAAARLRVDTRKWIVSKKLPKKYGEKITQEVTGANGEAFNSMPPVIQVSFVDNKGDDNGGSDASPDSQEVHSSVWTG